MALNAGTSTTLEGSMAGAIEQAFREEWPSVMKTEAPGPNPQMQLLFLAVAKGVVRHLVAHPEAFVIRLSGLDKEVNLTVEIKSTEAP